MSQQRSSFNPATALAGTGLAALAGGLAYSAFVVPHALPLPPALPGEREHLLSSAGELSYYVAGEGAPMLLIHSINAAASAYEVRPVFEHFAATRRVYALDLPGFGFSERGDRDYTPQLFTSAVLAMAEYIGQQHESQPIDALALSLGCEFLARAAAHEPGLFRSLALVSPTAFGADNAFYGETDSVRGKPALKQVFAFPLWRQGLFDLLNSRVSQRYYLEKTFGSSEVDLGLLHYEYLTAHQPGAAFAPLTFISGSLFSADINRVYEELPQPIWLAHGSRGDFQDYGGIGKVAALPNWSVQRFETGALPYFEQTMAFLDAYERFLIAN